MYWKPPKALRAPMDAEFLANEPEVDKALRWLRSFRHFVKSKRFSVMCVQLDGQTLMVLKSGRLNLPPEADLTLSMDDPYPDTDHQPEGTTP
jgi:hypothetical protein